MRAAIKKSLGFAVFALGMCASSAQAQDVTINVPFAFVVQGQTLPAGNYVVSSVNQDHSAMAIRGEDSNSKSMAIVLTRPADGHDPAGDKPTLIFSRFENGYRLSTIWEGGTEGQTMASNKG